MFTAIQADPEVAFRNYRAKNFHVLFYTSKSDWKALWIVFIHHDWTFKIIFAFWLENHI